MTALAGLSILVVEDEFLVAATLADVLEEAGAQVLGPAGSLSQGLAEAESSAIDLAVLDWNLAGECSDVIARVLDVRGIPYVIATGYGAVPAEFAGAPVLPKPFDPHRLVESLARLAAGALGTSG